MNETESIPLTDPYNLAVARILDEEFKRQDYGMLRLVRATGIPRATLRRYFDGTRDIRVSNLRLIASALGLTVGEIVDRADAEVQ